MGGKTGCLLSVFIRVYPRFVFFVTVLKANREVNAGLFLTNHPI